MSGNYRHEITIAPSAVNGERGWWTASVGKDGEVSYDGQGRSIEEALCDLIDIMAVHLL